MQASACTHAEPQVGPLEQPPVEERRVAGAGPPLHEPGLGRLAAERQRRHHVGAEIDGQDLEDGEGGRDAQRHHGHEGDHLGDVGGEDVGEELADVAEEAATLLDGRHQAGEVVVEQDQVGRGAGHVGAGGPHGDADVGGAQGRGVVDAVAGDRHHLAERLPGLDQPELLVGEDAGEEARRRIDEEGPERLVVEGGELRSGHRGELRAAHAHLAGHRQRRARPVAGHHHHPQPGLAAAAQRLGHAGPRRIVDGEEADQLEVRLQRGVRRARPAPSGRPRR